MVKINEITVGGVTYDIQDKNASPQSFAERMLEVDKRGLESGDYNKERYDAFRQKYPNRVYLERYKEVDGVKHEYIYNKVALTELPDPPEDFDTEDAGYYLDSVPIRYGGGQKGGADEYRKGHICVPSISAEEFPRGLNSEYFAVSRTYVDSADVRDNLKKINRYANTIDDKCIGVTATNGTLSGLQIYDNNGKSKYAVFKCSLWRDTSSSTSGSLELTLKDSSGNSLCYAIIFPYTTRWSYLSRPNGTKVYFDAKVHMPYRKWSEVYLEYDANACARLYIDGELVAETTDIGVTNNPIYMNVVSSKALQGDIALTNISFLTSDTQTELTDAHRFDCDNSSTWFATSATTGKRIARYGGDTWEIQDGENFTGEGEYVVVNKKYLRKMLENAGGGKMYRHRICMSFESEATHWGKIYCDILSSDSTHINTFDALYANADKLASATNITTEDLTTSDYVSGDFDDECTIDSISIRVGDWSPYFIDITYHNNTTNQKYTDYFWDVGGLGTTTINDTVTEV